MDQHCKSFQKRCKMLGNVGAFPWTVSIGTYKHSAKELAVRQSCGGQHHRVPWP